MSRERARGREPTRTEMFTRIQQLWLWKMFTGVWPLGLTAADQERFDLAAKISQGWVMVREAEAAITALRHTWAEIKGWAVPSRESLSAAIAAYEALPAAIRTRLEGQGDALPFLDEQGRAIYKTVQAGLSYSDLAECLSAVVECVWINCGADEAIRQTFEVWHREDSTYADLVTMRAAFLALPEHEQRRILNGWKPVIDWPPERDVIRFTAEADTTVRVLLLSSDGRESVASQSIIKRQTWRPAEVTIREGATKQEAVAAVRLILEQLESRWDELAGSEIDALIPSAKEEPQVPNSIVQKLGGKSDEAKTLTAS